jgi:hypothetical protein
MAIEEGKYLSDFLKWELDRNYCREIVTVAEGQNLKAGAVVGLVTKAGNAAVGQVKAVRLLTGEENASSLIGDEIAVGVLLEDADATDDAKEALMLARIAIVADGGIVFSAVPTAAQKAKIVADLDARGIVIRKSV